MNGGNVYVHCSAGVSRSSTITLSYMMTVYDLPFEEVYLFICLFVYLFICLFVYLFICLFVYLFICCCGVGDLFFQKLSFSGKREKKGKE